MLSLPLGAALAAPVQDIDTPLRTGHRSPNDAAVVIGIEDYAFIGQVPFARRDAKAFYDLLVYTRGVPSSQVTLLDRGANREMILAAVRDTVKQLGPEGTLWVYYAGHGAASLETGERMLLGDDVRSDPSAFEARAVRLSELTAALGGARSVLVLDTCYSGKGRTGVDLMAGTRFAVPAYALAASPTRLEWTAADANELAKPLHDAQHGAFTYFVVGALRGWADGQVTGERDGRVTAEEAQLYVRDALLSARIDAQTPVMTTATPSWELSSGAAERGPGTVEVVARAAGADFMATLAELEAREAEVQKAREGILAEARLAWARTQEFTAADLRERAVRAFVESYGAAAVEAGGVVLPLVVPEVALAREQLGSRGRLEGPYPLVRIEPGTFTTRHMLPDDAPANEVTLTRPFYLGETEVSQRLWEEVMGPVDWGASCPKELQGDTLPVVCVTFRQAVAFANRLSEREGLAPAYVIDGDAIRWDRAADGYRLPSVSEWLYVAEPAFDATRSPCELGNVGGADTQLQEDRSVLEACTDGHGLTHPVGAYGVRPRGIADLYGNVSEWAWHSLGSIDGVDPNARDMAGMGLTIEATPEGIRVVEVFPGQAGAEAALQPGDVLVRIMGRETAGMKVSDAVQLLVGPAGTTLTLEVRKGDKKKLQTLEVTRRVLTGPTVPRFVVGSTWALASWQPSRTGGAPGTDTPYRTVGIRLARNAEGSTNPRDADQRREK